MAYSEALAVRIREALAGTPGVTEKRMFGGLAIMLHGQLFVGVVDSTLMARVGPADYEASLSRPHVREMDFTGKPMRGYVFVDPPGLRTARQLESWASQCRAFVGTLPKKARK